MSKRNPHEKALQTLDGMAQIVRAEAMARGSYVGDDAPPEAPPICQGVRACAVGSLYLAYGVRSKVAEDGDRYLPGVYAFERKGFMERRAGLRLAYDALNEAADRYAERRRINLDEHSYMGPRAGALERLFEHDAGEDEVPRGDLLRIIAGAKRRVKASA